MKKLILSFGFSLLVAATFAQSDSTVTLTLSAQEHAFIYSFMPSSIGVDDINYSNQVAKHMKMDSS